MSDRRYHAQPIACPECGPKIWFESKADSLKHTFGEQRGLQQAVELIQSGGVLASRPTKPLAIMVRDLEVAKRFVVIDSTIEAQLLSSAAPIVLSTIKTNSLLATSVNCGLGTLGIMLPYSPLHHLLLSAFDQPLVMTSGNSKGAPQVTQNKAARIELAGIADGWLLHNREIENRVDDSVVQITGSRTAQVLRRARGLAPDLMSLPDGFGHHPDAIAFGADSKNAFALAKGGRAILSQHIGDLGDPRTAQELLENIKHLTELFDVHPRVVFCDLHNGYRSTQMAQAYAHTRDLPIFHIQHHHAEVWGAEMLRVNYDSMERIASLTTAAMQGGDAAAKEPWRNLVARLFSHYGSHEFWPQEYQTQLLNCHVGPACAAILANINSPLASSAGRLFDAVAAALGYAPIRQSYEGEAALQLQHAATSYINTHGCPDPFTFRLEPADARQGLIEIDPSPIWDALCGEIKTGSPARAAARFHLGWADVWSQVALQSSNGTPIALSGGSFQNLLLSNRLVDTLESAGRQVLLHAAVPPNDGGIALGQLAVGLRQCQSSSFERD